MAKGLPKIQSTKVDLRNFSRDLTDKKDDRGQETTVTLIKVREKGNML